MLLILLLIPLLWLAVMAIVMAACQTAARADGYELEFRRRSELELQRRKCVQSRRTRARRSRTATSLR
jgi:Ni/Co efflux regulator RcnB